MFRKFTSLVLAVTLLSLPGYLRAIDPKAEATEPAAVTYEASDVLPTDELETVQVIEAVKVSVNKVQKTEPVAASDVLPTDEPETPVETKASVIFESDEDGSGINLAAQDVPQETIELLAKVTMAEAEGESELGKRLVIDTILNRVDDSRFPSTIYDVIYQSGQFVCMTNGRINSCYASEDICQLVQEELNCRTNSQVLYFSAGGYSAYGTPILQEGNHYFSG